MAVKRIGILTGGGDVPGLNSVIGAATIRARVEGVEVLGVRDGFEWIMQGDVDHITPLTIEVRLPPDWLERVGAHRSARVAVLVTSGVLVLPQDRVEVQKAKDVRRTPICRFVTEHLRRRSDARRQSMAQHKGNKPVPPLKFR